MKKKYQSGLLLVIFLFLFFYALFHTRMIAEESIFYLRLFLTKVFPTTFCFLLLSSFLLEYQFLYFFHRIFPRSSPAFVLFCLSLVSGFPMGALYVSRFLKEGVISFEEANRYIRFTHFPNPFFVLYTTSSLFHSYRLAFCFLGIFFFSNFVIYLFTKKENQIRTYSFQNTKTFAEIFSQSLFQTVRVLISIFGTSLFFYLISCGIRPFLTRSSFLYVFISGLFDLTNGVFTASILTSPFLQGVLLFFFMGIGSFSIQLQIKSILQDTSISYGSFLKGRVLCFLCCIFLWLFCCTSRIVNWSYNVNGISSPKVWMVKANIDS